MIPTHFYIIIIIDVPRNEELSEKKNKFSESFCVGVYNWPKNGHCNLSVVNKRKVRTQKKNAQDTISNCTAFLWPIKHKMLTTVRDKGFEEGVSLIRGI